MYYFCFFHIYSKSHKNYHHVIIQTDDINEITGMEGDSYEYHLMSAVPVDPRKIEADDTITRGLIMDGESLFKRINQFKKQKQIA